MGLKNLLAAAANDMEQTNKAQGKPEEKKGVTVPSKEIDTEAKPKEKKAEDKKKEKKFGGRPTNEEKGLASRKQYTLTLKEDTYRLIFEKAREEDISFAKFLERAALEYIRNHE